MKKIHQQGMPSVFSLSIEMERLSNAKLRLNYLMVIAIIGEFCNKWTFSIFDSVVPMYGKDHYSLDPFTFRYTMLDALNVA